MSARDHVTNDHVPGSRLIFTFCYWQLNLKLRCDVLQESVPYLGEIWLNWPNIITIIRPWSSRRRKKPQIVIAGEKTAGVESQLLWRFWCNFDKLDGNAETCSVLSSRSAAIRKLRHFLLIFISHSRLRAQHIQWILTWNKTLMINIFFKLDNVYANLYFTYSCFGKLFNKFNQAPLSLSSGYVLQSWCIISTRFQTL